MMAETEEHEQPVHKGLKKGLYLIPSAFTAANIGMGFFAVIESLHGFHYALLKTTSQDFARAGEYFDKAAIAILFAILFDTLDGRVARMTKTATEIGVQLDSLADVLTFGIAPTILAYGWAIGANFSSEDNSMNGLGLFVLFMYLMCGTFRLARFNLQATRPRVLKEGTPKIDKKNFVGLPIPPAAGLLAAIIHFKPRPLNSYENWSDVYTILIMVLLAGLGLLMVSTIRYTSFKNIGVSRRSVYLILLIAAVGMLAWLYSRYVFLVIAIAYVSHGLIFYLVGLLRPSKNKQEVYEEFDH